MSMTSDAGTAFDPVRAELDRWAEAGKRARFWLRDDDAHEPTPALDQFLAQIGHYKAPCLIAVIPMLAGPALVERLAGNAEARFAVHGIRHHNTAPPGERPRELALHLGLETIRAGLAEARARLVSLFGPRAGRWYVPPWNRIDAPVVEELPALGFAALSTFGPAPEAPPRPALRILNPVVDIINWKAGRVGHPPVILAQKLATALIEAREGGFLPLGVLTHHLAHDAMSWSGLAQILALVDSHPAAYWGDPDALLDEVLAQNGALGMAPLPNEMME